MKSPLVFPAALAITVALMLPAAAQSTAPREVNGIAAKVNGRVITKNEVSFMLAPIFAQLNAQYPRRGKEFAKKLEEAKSNILQELIDRQIILDEFKQIGATMNSHAVEDEIKRQINNLYDGDKSKFNQELRNSRLTMEGYREMTREKMIVQAMRAHQFSDAPPPLPNEIRNEYNAIKNDIRDTSKDVITYNKIFIPAQDPENPAATRETQLQLAELITKELKDGASFEKLAKTHSKGPFAADGGVYEDTPRSDLSAEFAAIIFDAGEGAILGPLVDSLGFTIVQPVDIKLGPVPSLDKVRDVVESRVRKKKTSKQYDRWIESRRKRAMVDIKI